MRSRRCGRPVNDPAAARARGSSTPASCIAAAMARRALLWLCRPESPGRRPHPGILRQMDVGGVLVSGDAERRRISAIRFVPVEMIRDVGVTAAVTSGAPGDRRRSPPAAEHGAGEFEHHRIGGPDLVDGRQQRSADVPPSTLATSQDRRWCVNAAVVDSARRPRDADHAAAIQLRDQDRISVVTGTPARQAACRQSLFHGRGTAGLATTRSVSGSLRSGARPAATAGGRVPVQYRNGVGEFLPVGEIGDQHLGSPVQPPPATPRPPPNRPRPSTVTRRIGLRAEWWAWIECTPDR